MKCVHPASICCGLLLYVSWVAQATQPPPPGSLAMYQQDGSYARRRAFVEQLGNHVVRPDVARRTRARLQALVAGDASFGLLPAWEGMRTKGTNQMLVLLIEFPDYPHVNDQAAIEHKLRGLGDPEDYPLECLRSYYLRSSYGQLDLVPTVLDWHRVQHNRDWYTQTYGEGGAANRAIIQEAIGRWDAAHDFSRYDNDGDGEVDYLAVLWAGPDNGWGNFWWGYASRLSEPILADNVRLRTYTWQWESNPVGQEFSPAVLMHETGHVLGLPDYYDYDSRVGPRGGVGGLDMMDAIRGDHNAFSKFMLDWLTPLAIAAGRTNVTLRALAGDPDALVLMPEYAGATPYAEYFMVENRHRVQNDTKNPGDGLLLWHVDARTDSTGQNFLYNNSFTDHKLLRLMEADGLEQIESGWDGNAADYYGQGSVFSPVTRPNSRAYSGANTDVVVDQIPAPAPVMTFRAGMLPEPPSLLVQPQSRQVMAGSTVTFGTVVAGSEPLLMQWWKDGVAVPGATGPILTLYRITVSDAGVYSLHLTNRLGTAMSAGAALTILGSLTLADALDADLEWSTGSAMAWLPGTEIAWDLVDAASSSGVPDASESWLETGASGPVELSFWWKVSSEADADFLEFYLDGQLQPGRISGEADWRQLAFHLGPGWHTLRWRYVKDGAGNAGSDAGWLDLVTLAPSVAPVITEHPRKTDIAAGAEATLVVSASGSWPLVYQWLKNGALIAGATQPLLRLPSVQVEDTGSYAVVVSNAVGSVLSSNAILKVWVTPPNILVQPRHQVADVGGSATFTVEVIGASPRYQWRKDGVDLPGQTNAALHLANAQTNDAGAYRVRIDTPGGSVISSNAMLWVPAPLAFLGEWPGYARGPGRAVHVVGSLGFMALHNAGFAILDLSNPAAPTRVGGYETGSLAQDVVVRLPYAFVGTSSGLQVIDVRDPAHPIRAGRLDTPHGIYAVALAGARAYLAAGTSGFDVVDVSDPARLVLVRSVNAGVDFRAIAVAGHHAYLAGGTVGVLVFDVSNPDDPMEINRCETPGIACGLWIAGHALYIADEHAGLQIVDISDPRQPYLLGALDTSGKVMDVCALGETVWLADGLDGVKAVDVRNPHQPALLGSLAGVSAAWGIHVQGDFAYVAEQNGLQIVDIRNPLVPVRTGGWQSCASGADVDVAGRHAYLADGESGLQILDVEDAAAPRPVASYNSSSRMQDVQVVGTYAYVADFEAGLQTLDVSNPLNPVRTAIFDTDGQSKGISVLGAVAGVADGDAGVQIFDLMEPKVPLWINRLPAGGIAQHIALRGPYAYLANDAAGIAIIDLTTPRHPVLAASLDTLGRACGVCVSRGYLYVADSGAGLQVIDIHDPAHPQWIGLGASHEDATDVQVVGRYAYVANGDDGVSIFDVAAPTQPVLAGQYRLPARVLGIRVVDQRVYAAMDQRGLAILETRLSTDELPDIVVTPLDQTAAAGCDFTWTVMASGTLPLQFQWYKDDQIVPGATNATLTLPAVTTNDAGNYFIIVSNALGTATSAAARLTVVVLGWELTDDFEPDRDPLQWSEARGLVVATNFGGSISPSNSLWFGGPVERMITTRVLNTTNGGTLSFWLRLGDSSAAFWDAPELPADGVVFEYAVGPAGPWTILLSCKTPEFRRWTNVLLNIPIEAQAPAVRFRWRQLEHSGEGDHWALDDVQILPEPMPSAPVITAQPADQWIAPGAPAVFLVSVRGTVPLTFQWRFQGTNLPGATGPRLNLPVVTVLELGSYAVVVSNPCGSVTSTVAQLCFSDPGHLAALPRITLSVRGQVNAAAWQPDGKIVLGGSFESVNGVRRKNLARLNPDGSLDLGWAPEPSGPVHALGLGDQGVYVGGFFFQVNGQAFTNLVKLAMSGAGNPDVAWRPNPDLGVATLRVHGTNVFLGGYFTRVAGQSRTNLAKIDAGGTGQVDPQWAPHADGPVFALAVRNGSLFVGGGFTRIRGQARNYIAKLETTGMGSVDPVWNPNASNPVSALEVTDTEVYVGGSFQSIGGLTRNYLAKVAADGTGAVGPLWDPNASDPVSALACDGASVFAGGTFQQIGGRSVNALAKLTANGAGAADPAWVPALDGSVAALALSGHALFVGGSFVWTNGAAALSAVRLETTNGVPAGIAPIVANRGWISTLAPHEDGRLTVGGSFDMADDQLRLNLARFHANGTLDREWHPQANLEVRTLLVAETNLYVGGSFSQVGGEARSGIARLSALGVGLADPTWDPQPNGTVSALALDGGQLYIAGNFNSVRGQVRNCLARLSLDGYGACDPTWNPNVQYQIEAMVIQGTNLFIGGYFNTVGGLLRSRLAKLSTTSTGPVDPDWNPKPSRNVAWLAVTGTNLLVGGYFTSIGGQPRLRLAKLSLEGAGAADPLWAPDPSSAVTALAVSGSNVYVSGSFTRIGGQDIANLARVGLNSNGAADPVWKPTPDDQVQALALAPEGLYLGGRFTAVGGRPRAGVALITLKPIAPWIVQPPQPQSAAFGGSARFTVVANGTEPVAYQWNLDGVPLQGATNSSLVLTQIRPSQAGAYDVTVSNALGQATSISAVLELPPLPPARMVALTLAEGQLHFTLTAAAHLEYRLQASADLEQWTDLGTLLLTNDGVEVQQPLGDRWQFYRALLVP